MTELEKLQEEKKEIQKKITAIKRAERAKHHKNTIIVNRVKFWKKNYTHSGYEWRIDRNAYYGNGIRDDTYWKNILHSHNWADNSKEHFIKEFDALMDDLLELQKRIHSEEGEA